MATLVTLIPTLTFPEELDMLEFSGSSGAQFKLKVMVNTDVLLDEVFTFAGDTLRIYDLASLLRDFAKQPVNEVQLFLDGSVVATTSMLQCRLCIAEKAADFVGKRFLSQCGDCKSIYDDSIEYLSYYSETGTEDITVNFRELTGLLDIFDHTQHKQIVREPGVTTLELNFAELIRKARLQNIITIEVTVGKRSISYVWTYGSSPDYQQMSFVNSFGVKESVFFNDVAQNLKTSYNMARVHGKLRNYNTTSTKEYTAYADAIDQSDCDTYMDFCRANEIWRTSDNVPMVLTSSKYDDPGTGDTIASLKATWCESGEVPYYNPRLVEVKLFDETFDLTFN